MTSPPELQERYRPAEHRRTVFPPTVFPPTVFPPTGYPPTGYPPTGGAPTGFPQARYGLWAGLILLIGALLRCYHLGGQSLWMDEGFTAMMAATPLAHLGDTGLGIEKHPPLYYLLARLGMTLLGATELALRLPAALAGVASLLVVAEVALAWGSSQAALGATLLLGVSSLHVMMCRDARGYGVATLLLLLATRNWLRLLAVVEAPPPLEEGSPQAAPPSLNRLWLSYLLACTGACYTHYLCTLAIAWQWCSSLATVWRHRDHSEGRALVLRWVATPLVLLLAALPWVPVVRAQAATPSPGHAPASWWDLGDVAWAQCVGFTLNRRNYFAWGPVEGGWLQIALVVTATLGLIALGLGPGNQDRPSGGEGVETSPSTRARRRVVGMFFAFCTSLVVISKCSGLGLFETRYTVLVTPLFWLGVAWGLEALTQRGWRLGATTLVVGYVALNLCGTYNFLALEEWQRQDARGLAAVLRERTHPGDLVLLEGDWAVPVLHFYLPAAPLGVQILPLDGRSVEAFDPHTLPPARRVWLACCSASLVDPRERMREQLGRVRRPGWHWEARRRNASFDVSATLYAPYPKAGVGLHAPGR